MEPPVYCNGKIRYARKRDAATARNARLRHTAHRPDALRVYHCPDCNGHHLTSSALPLTRLERFARRFVSNPLNHHQHAPL